MKKNLLVLFLFAIMVTFIFTTQASASYVVYTDKTAWGTAVGSYVTEDFSDTILNPGISYTYNEALGRTFVTGGVWQNYVNKDVIPPWIATWSFDTPITAFGGNWDVSPIGYGSGVAFTTNTGGLVPGNSVTQSYTGQFFGFISSTAFSSVTLSAGFSIPDPGHIGDTYTLDNLVYSPVPIPPAIWLLGTGLIGLIGLRRHINV